jgi:ABC-type molybdate transport system substrate-binding protein
MLRWLSLTILFALALTFTGCGSSSSEIPAKKATGEVKVSAQESMQKAMQGMPPEMQKKMTGAQMKK